MLGDSDQIRLEFGWRIEMEFGWRIEMEDSRSPVYEIEIDWR